MQSRADESEPHSIVLAKMLSHPTRVRILMAMNGPPTRMSPNEFRAISDQTLAHVSFHFRELAKHEFIRLVDQQPRRGATEHFYEPVQTALAWKDEWERLGPLVGAVLSVSVLGGAVRAIGAAIDAGTFGARSDSHLSWNTIRIDKEGWGKAGEVLDRALSALLQIESESLARESPENPIFVASHLMSLFESSPALAGNRPSGDGES